MGVGGDIRENVIKFSLIYPPTSTLILKFSLVSPPTPNLLALTPHITVGLGEILGRSYLKGKGGGRY
jgi:hypothetical protein